MTTTTMFNDIWAARGDLVTHPSSGDKVYKVIKVNPANYRVEDEAGKQWNLPRRSARRAPAEATFTSRKPLPEPRFPGDTVRFIAPHSGRFPGVYVFLRETSPGRGKFARLNGRTHQVVTAALSTVISVEV